MALIDPVAVYNAENNVEAHFVQNLLTEAGVEASVTEDVSAAGFWLAGLLPEIHKPQVWVSRADLDQAVPLVADYDSRVVARRRAEFSQLKPDQTIATATCDQCGQVTEFPATLYGKVQKCGRCGAYVDVGGEDEAAEMMDAECGEEEPPERSES